MMAATPQLSVVKFKESGRNVTYVASVNDIKDFNPVSNDDFIRDKEYEVKWQKSDLEFDGFYQAKILCLAATISEIDVKVRKNKWKAPINLSALMSSNEREPTKTMKLLHNRSRVSDSRANLRSAKLAGDLSRMETVLARIDTSKFKTELAYPEEVKKKDEGDSLDDTLPVSENNSDSDSDSDDIAMKIVELQRDYDNLQSKSVKLEKKYEEVSKLHSSCAAAIALADSRWKECQAEFENYKRMSQEKIKFIALANVKLQLELKKKPSAVQPKFIGSTPKKDCSASESDLIFSEPDVSPDSSLDKSKVKRVPKVSDEEMLEELSLIADRVCKDIKGTERLPESNGKVILDGSIGVNAIFWKKKLRTAETDSKFINKFPPALWTPAQMVQRRLHGGTKDSKCKAATPDKVKVIMGSLEGRLRADGVSGDAAILRRQGAKKTLERKFIDFSRKLKKGEATDGQKTEEPRDIKKEDDSAQ